MPVMSDDDYSYNQLMKTFPSLPEPAFESREMQELVWKAQWGCTNDVGKLRVVLVHRPGDEVGFVETSAFLSEIGAYGDPKAGWYWRGKEPPDLPRMQEQHDRLTQVLRAEGVRVENIEDVPRRQHKSVSTRDAVVAVDGGAIVCRLGTRYRRGEEIAASRKLAEIGMPILRTIHGTGIFEGGSFAWLDAKTAVVGLSTRVNEEGARQVEEVLRVTGVELIRVHLTGYRQHIDGLLVMIDIATVLINPVLTPFCLIERLREMKFKIIELHPEDHPFTINCLAVAPGRVIMSEASRRTLDRLDREGITVISIPFDAVYRGGGGIHCSTAPLLRDPAD
ncbi:MAG TPA: arginine deiminase family protein [Alphaproteobacteria bacterium]|nr:arginine deiminase family protein [Alphaproteobacteria bacterium]